MHPYYSTEWETLPRISLTSYNDWYPSVIDSTEAKDDLWFDKISYEPKLEPHGSFDMHGDYIDRTIVQDTQIYYFDANTYD